MREITLLYFFCFHILSVTATSIVKNTDTTKKINSLEDVKTTTFEKLEKHLKHKTSVVALRLKNNNENSFYWETMEKMYSISNVVEENRDLAAGSFKVIEEHKSWVDSFSNEDIQELPVGVKHTRENIEYAIGITEATLNKDYTELTVFARVRLPQTDSSGYPIELFFGANNVRLSHQGGIVGDANLVLLGDMHLSFNGGKWMLTLKGGFDYKTGNVENRTYVTINCDGVKELGIDGLVEFSRELIIPIESKGSKKGTVDASKTKVNETIETENGTQVIQVPYRVKGGFKVVVSDWNDLLVDIDLQPFVMAKKRNKKDYQGNFQFFVNQAVLDFSDLRNDPAVEFPGYYHENGLLIPNERSWRGVYVNTVEVKMPTEFMTSNTIKRGGNERVAFGAHHLIIDNYGVSGTFYADNVFTLDEGRTNDSKAWAYSLDHIEVSLAANNFIGADIEGRILLPVSKKEKSTNSSPDRIGLKYIGIISPEEYLLNVSNDSIIDFNLWKAKGQLLPNSSIELTVRDGQFRPKATLHGRLSISASQVKSLKDEGEPEVREEEKEKGKQKLVEFKGIVFQNLILQTESPVFAVDYMGYQEEVAIAGFPVSISNISITTNEQSANLYFDLAINLMGDTNGFAAETSLGIIGSFEEEDYRQKWKFDGIELGTITIDADMGGFSMHGSLTLLNDDSDYGDGFAASLGLKLEKSKIDIEANGVFGKTTFRFWMVDAKVDGIKGVNISGLNITGFVGGASYKMRKKGFTSSLTSSGLSFTPDVDLGLGFKAGVIFNYGNKSIAQGAASFDMLFNSTGGLNYMGFFGQAEIFSVKGLPGMNTVDGLVSRIKKDIASKDSFLGIKKEASFEGNGIGNWVGKNLLDKVDNEFPGNAPESVSMLVKVGISYDFQNAVLHGDMEAFVNEPTGMITGRGAKGRAGWAVLHVDSKEWYLYLGTPEDRLGLRIGVGPLSVETGGYFMTGSKLPGSPPPPPIVAEILGVDADVLDYMRDENALKSGGGFAFGTDLAIDTGDLRFLIFYARFQAGTGFDIMLRDYGEASCSNTGKQVGINGWYANGQAYAYLQGELGVRIKLFFVKKKIPLIKGGAAVLLQIKAPNPVWMRGYVGGNFNVLGGLVKGKFRFKLTIGEECEFDNGTPLGGLKIITDVSPDNGIKDLDIFVIPQVTFSMKVGEPLIIPEDDGDKIYRIDVEQFAILHNGQEIPGAIEWSTFKDRANFVSSDILPPNEELTVHIEVTFKEKINGIFQAIMIDGKPAKEIEERTFTTGGAPNYIPLHNIRYAYPVVGQKYFLEDEYAQGYIQLKRGQDYLFDDAAWESFIKYNTNNRNSEDIDFNYSTTNNKLTYNIPNISQETQYTMQIASRLKGTVVENEGNTTSKNVDIGDDSGENMATIENKQAENVSKNGEIERLTYEFGSSKYKTFKRKISSINTNDYNWGAIYSDVIYLTNSFDDHEPFDIMELLGADYTDNIPLVSVKATLKDRYFTADINPSLYAHYPLGGQYVFENRDEQTLGIPPKYALPILSTYLSNLKYEVNEKMLRTTFPFRYNLGFVYKADWVDMQSQILNDYLEELIPNGSSLLNFLDKDYLFMRYGFYKTKLSYKLPGGIKGSSSLYKFKNPNKFR